MFIRLWIFSKEGKQSRTTGYSTSSLMVIIDLILLPKDFLSQVEGINFDELFSPVVHYETAQLLLAVAVLEDLDIQSIDIKTAYLYGDLDKKIYME